MNENLHELVRQNHARDFLKLALLLRYSRNGKINISEFSKMAGFSSRSFISEYLAGKKKLSQDSFVKIKQALALPKDYANLFYCLVLQDQEELRQGKEINVENEIQLIKNILNQSQGLEQNPAKKKALLKKRQALRVYASLNDRQTGATIFEVIKKTGMSLSRAQECLQHLLDQSVVMYKDQKFYATEEKLDFFNFKESELSDLTKEITAEINTQSEQLVKDESSFVFYSAISIDKDRMAQFKEKMRIALYNVMDEFQVDNGNQTEQIFVCLKQ